jgi:phage baseplate assembly protein W
MQATSFLGKGLSFPVVLENGSAKLSDHYILIESSIKTILSWPLYQRFFNPYFGSRLWQLLGEPNDLVLHSLVNTFIIEALSYWEKRITILESSIASLEADKLIVNISYKIKKSSELRELAYTFYLNTYEY